MTGCQNKNFLRRQNGLLAFTKQWTLSGHQNKQIPNGLFGFKIFCAESKCKEPHSYLSQRFLDMLTGKFCYHSCVYYLVHTQRLQIGLWVIKGFTGFFTSRLLIPLHFRLKKPKVLNIPRACSLLLIQPELGSHFIKKPTAFSQLFRANIVAQRKTKI